jgi:hypothetical protein
METKMIFGQLFDAISGAHTFTLVSRRGGAALEHRSCAGEGRSFRYTTTSPASFIQGGAAATPVVNSQ